MAPPILARLIAAPALLAALGACLQDPYARDISSADFSDASLVAEIAASLDEQDRGTFKTYVLRHVVSAKNACGKADRHEASARPVTVAEALSLTRQWEAEDAAVNPDVSKMTALQRERHELDLLRKQVSEELDMQADMLMASTDPDPRNTEANRQFEARIAALAARIAKKEAALHAKTQPKS